MESLEVQRGTLIDRYVVLRCLGSGSMGWRRRVRKSIFLREAKYELAHKSIEQALSIVEHTTGPDHPNTAKALHSFGDVLIREGRYQEAATTLERALAIQEKAFGSKHQDLALSLMSIGELRVRQGKYSLALTFYQRALRNLEESLSKDHPHVAFALRGLGLCHLRMGQAKEALPLLERAVLINKTQASNPLELTEAHSLLAQARFAIGRDRNEALDLARQARQAYAQFGATASSEFAEFDAWLRQAEKQQAAAKP